LKKSPTSPDRSSLVVYWRLFWTFAKPYWFQLFLGISAGLIMGGAMHAYLRFMDLGLNALETGYVQKATGQEKTSLLDKLQDNRTFNWLLKVTRSSLPRQDEPPDRRQPAETTGTARPTGNTTITETGAPAPAMTGAGDAAAAPPAETGLFAKINAVTRRLGFEVDDQEALTFPLVCLLISIMFFYFVVKAVGEFVNRFFLRWVGAKVVADIRLALFNNLQKQSVAYFDQHDVGQLISRCTYDTGAIEHSVANSVAELCTAPIMILVAIQFIIQKALEVRLFQPTLIFIIAMPLCTVPIFMVSRYVRKYQRGVLLRISELVARMQENFTGIRVVKAFHMEDHESARFRRENKGYFRAVVKAMLADVFVQPTMQMTAIGLGAMFIILCYHYNVSLGTLAVIGYAAQQAYKPIKELAKLNSNLQKSAAAAERIFEVLDTDTGLPLPPNPVRLPSFTDRIAFEHVSFAYNDTTGPVLADVNVAIRKGQLVAIVGQTGSGKSTMAALLARFYDPTAGQVTLDGHDLKTLEPADFRRLLGIVSQDTFLFNDTLADNIRFGTPDASDDDVIAAARRANAHDFIVADPLGYQRFAGERGNLLSGGQKQRIAIARAILKNPPILILDEATSALDTVTEQLVQQAITEIMQDRTVLAIAHRLSTIVKADLILVMDQGRVVEQGTHQELFEQNGFYRNLYDRQFARTDAGAGV
jgi:subfamily B ATP-binding cassette protein MsbA